MNENNKYFAFIPLMPDGKPCSTVLLEADLIGFLRLKELCIKNPENTLRYYRERGKLKPTRISGRNVYTVKTALDFLEEMTNKFDKN